jgi:hypothetical protein
MHAPACSGSSGCGPAGAGRGGSGPSSDASSAATKTGRAPSGLTIDVYTTGTDQPGRCRPRLPPVLAADDAQRPPSHRQLQRVLQVEARAPSGRLPSPRPERPPQLRLPAHSAADSLAASCWPDSTQGSCCSSWEAAGPPDCLPPPLFGWQQGDGSLRMHPHIELLVQSSRAAGPSPLRRGFSASALA